MSGPRYSHIISLCIWTAISAAVVSCRFAHEKRITGKYYIIGVDTRDQHGLCYNLGGGSYVGRAPGQLIEYGFNDTFLVAKTIADKNASAEFYIINMSKDFAEAEDNDYRLGPFSEADYNRLWSHRLNLKLRKVQP